MHLTKQIVCAPASTQPRSRLASIEPISLGGKSAPPSQRTVTRAPLLLRLAKSMVRHRIRGGDRLVDILDHLGLLDVVVRYQLGRGVAFSVPLFRPDTCWDQKEVE